MKYLWVLLAIMAVSPIASAATLTYDYTREYSGGAEPAGPVPWLRAVIDDGGAPGSVTMTLTAENLVDSEFIRSVYFSLDPALDPMDLSMSVESKIGELRAPWAGRRADRYWAGGGGGFFDLRLGFATSNVGDGMKRFGVGEGIVLAFSGISELTADSFDFLSKTRNGKEPLVTASHIQGIYGDDSGWVTGDAVGGVPEPMTMSLLAIGGLALIRRRQK